MAKYTNALLALTLTLTTTPALAQDRWSTSIDDSVQALVNSGNEPCEAIFKVTDTWLAKSEPRTLNISRYTSANVMDCVNNKLQEEKRGVEYQPFPGSPLYFTNVN